MKALIIFVLLLAITVHGVPKLSENSGRTSSRQQDVMAIMADAEDIMSNEIPRTVDPPSHVTLKNHASFKSLERSSFVEDVTTSMPHPTSTSTPGVTPTQSVLTESPQSSSNSTHSAGEGIIGSLFRFVVDSIFGNPTERSVTRTASSNSTHDVPVEHCSNHTTRSNFYHFTSPIMRFYRPLRRFFWAN